MMDWSDNPAWLVFGLLGNAAFGSRFLLQWLASERRGESFVPVAFWYLSIVGSLILLIYAIHLENVVFTLAYLPNAFVYYRNLSLIRKKAQQGDQSDATASSTSRSG